MSTDFWLGVTQTAIGSGLGFALGIGAFHYQQKRQSAKKEASDRQAAHDALNRLINTAGANIEALVISKLQILNYLKPEVENMKAAVEEIRIMPVEERQENISDLINLSGSNRHFYLSFQRNSVMMPPEYSEYSLLSKDMPALSMFVHRAMAMMQDINERIMSRNGLMAEFARENGMGVTAERIIYFSSMLSGESEAICKNTDFALNFWRLVLDQIGAYRAVKDVGGHLLKFELTPKADEAMPQKELFPPMREQLTTFTDLES